MTIEATANENGYLNTLLITSKAGTWELLINYFKQDYKNTVGENGLGLNRPRHYYQIVQEVLYQQ